jgi:hypothetical protein
MQMQLSYLLAASRTARLDAVAALDDVRLERDGPWAAMQLQEEAAGIAQDGAGFIASPQRRGARGTVLADRLSIERVQLVAANRLRDAIRNGTGSSADADAAQVGENIPVSLPVHQQSRAQQSHRSC